MTPRDCTYPTTHQTVCILDHNNDKIITALVRSIKNITDTECTVLAECMSDEETYIRECKLQKSAFNKTWAHNPMDLYQSLINQST